MENMSILQPQNKQGVLDKLPKQKHKDVPTNLMCK